MSKPTLSRRDGGWALCGSCLRERTWAGDVDPGCDCPGKGAMVVTYEEGDFTITGPAPDRTLAAPLAQPMDRAQRRARGAR